MIDDLLALARALVIHPKWEWKAGMRAIGRWPDYPVRVFEFGENLSDTDDIREQPLSWRDAREYGDHSYEGPYVPDLRDPATAGVLLEMLPANRIQGVRPLVDDIGGTSGWRVDICRRPMQAATPKSDFDYFIGDTLGEAAAQALLAVWGEKP